MKRFPPLVYCVLLLVSQSAHALIDTNSNGLSDLWEKLFSNNQLFPVSFNPLADPDKDSWTNIQEATAGTDPFSANAPDGFLAPDVERIPGDATAVPPTPQTHILTWPTIPGKTYLVLFSQDLEPAS